MQNFAEACAGQDQEPDRGDGEGVELNAPDFRPGEMFGFRAGLVCIPGQTLGLP